MTIVHSAPSENPWIPPQVQALASRERQVASMVYVEGAITASEIERRLRPPARNATVRKMLSRLMEKGIVRREQNLRGRGRECIYLPAVTPLRARRTALMEVVSRYFDDSLEDLIAEARSLLTADADANADVERGEPVARRASRSVADRRGLAA